MRLDSMHFATDYDKQRSLQEGTRKEIENILFKIDMFELRPFKKTFTTLIYIHLFPVKQGYPFLSIQFLKIAIKYCGLSIRFVFQLLSPFFKQILLNEARVMND